MTTPPLSYSITGASVATGLSPSYLDRAIKTGALRAKKSGRDKDGNPTGKHVILHADLEAYLDGLVDA